MPAESSGGCGQDPGRAEADPAVKAGQKDCNLNKEFNANLPEMVYTRAIWTFPGDLAYE